MTILLSLALFFICVSESFAFDNQLTIHNKSGVSVRVYVEGFSDSYINPIGFVDPGERITFSNRLKLGRWYLRILPQPDSYPSSYDSTLYVKQNQNIYVYEIYNSNFSNSTIPKPPNVSILGTWASGNGIATKFRREGDEYIGTLVAVPDSFSRFGYSSGMDWIKATRTDFHIYKGTMIKLDADGNSTNIKFSGMVENGNELYPHNWFRQK